MTGAAAIVSGISIVEFLRVPTLYLTKFILGVAPPAAPFAMPIAAGILFAAWVYEAVSVT